MNTPPTPKRHQFHIKGPLNHPDGVYSATITDAEIAARVGMVVARFVHLEHNMSYFFAALMGTDVSIAGYILRSIISARSRFDVMTGLLEKAQSNVDKPVEFDLILREFWSINKRRNAHVHGAWWSHEDGSMWLAEENEHGVGVTSAERVELAQMDDLLVRIGTLERKVITVALSYQK